MRCGRAALLSQYRPESEQHKREVLQFPGFIGLVVSREKPLIQDRIATSVEDHTCHRQCPAHWLLLSNWSFSQTICHDKLVPLLP